MIEWEDKYSVGISMIDDEHKKLIGILNKVIYARRHNCNPEELWEVLSEMTNYAITHFATEETYMEEFNYPEYQEHREEHNHFTTEIIAYHDKVSEGGFQIVNEILEFLKQWLVNHIQGTDTKYISCFKEHGLK